MTLETLQTMDTPALERALREKQGWRVSYHPIWFNNSGQPFHHLHSPGQTDEGRYLGHPRLSEAMAWANLPRLTWAELMEILDGLRDDAIFEAPDSAGIKPSVAVRRAILIACLQEEKRDTN